MIEFNIISVNSIPCQDEKKQDKKKQIIIIFKRKNFFLPSIWSEKKIIEILWKRIEQNEIKMTSKSISPQRQLNIKFVHLIFARNFKQ